MLTIVTAFVLRWHFGQQVLWFLSAEPLPQPGHSMPTPAAHLLSCWVSLVRWSNAERERKLTFSWGDTFLEELMPDSFTSQKAELCQPAWISHTLSGVTQAHCCFHSREHATQYWTQYWTSGEVFPNHLVNSRTLSKLFLKLLFSLPPEA